MREQRQDVQMWCRTAAARKTVSCPGRAAARSDAALSRGPGAASTKRGSRFSSAALRAALRPGHEAVRSGGGGGESRRCDEVLRTNAYTRGVFWDLSRYGDSLKRAVAH